MDYRIEIFDPEGRRTASFDRVPLLEVVRAAPDKADRVEGLLPLGIERIGPGWRMRVFIANRLVCDIPVVATRPQWSEARKLVLDRYVSFRGIVVVEGRTEPYAGNLLVAGAWKHAAVDVIARDLIQRAPGRVHYSVAHLDYPDGAQREFAKFIARRLPDNALPSGSIASGQWVGGTRIDAAGAFAKDGETIAGLVVDGVMWPDLRLMMVAAEQTSRNDRAIARHPETAAWSEARYQISGYRRRADAARTALQALIDAKGIDFIELNPHRDATGAYDGRVDAAGRYLGLVYGAGECFNAALVEQGAVDVLLHEDGRILDAAMALKDYFSYAGRHTDSIVHTPTILEDFDFSGGLLEGLTLLAYAGRRVWRIDPCLSISLCAAEPTDHVVPFIPQRVGVSLGADASSMVNVLVVQGHPLAGPFAVRRERSSSIACHGERKETLVCHALSRLDDAACLAEGLLDDLAFPELRAELLFFHGESRCAVGDLIEVRGSPLARLDRILPDEWGGRFHDRFAGRVTRIVHRLSGRDVTTRVSLTSPMRVVSNPLHAIVRSQLNAGAVYQLRLDDETVCLDAGYGLL